MALNKYKTLYCFLLIIALGLLTYSEPKISYSGDFGDLHKEKLLYENISDYFFNALSYNRTRHFNPGDTFLFRPVMTGFLAFCNIELLSQPLLQVYLAIIAHILCTCLIFNILRFYFPLFISLVLGLCYLFQISATTMLYNIHFNGYLLANLFILLGYHVLILVKKAPLKYFIATFLFFIAGCTHESIFLGLLLMALFFSKETKPLIPSSYLISINAIYFVVNLFSYLFYYSTYSSKRVLFSLNMISDFMSAPFYLIGMQVSGLLLGSTRSFTRTAGYILFIPVGIFICYALIKFIKKITPVLKNNEKSLFLFSVAMLVAYLLPIWFLRGTFRGLAYLHRAVWDDYLLSPYWIFIAAIVSKEVFNFRRATILARVILLFWILQNMITNWWHQKYYEALLAKGVQKIYDNLPSGYCYQATQNDGLGEYFENSPSILEELSCQKRGGKKVFFKVTPLRDVIASETSLL